MARLRDSSLESFISNRRRKPLVAEYNKDTASASFRAETSGDEYHRPLYPPSGYDHAGHAGHPAVRRDGLPRVARQRLAKRRFPDDPGPGRIPRRKPGDHGI